LLHRKPDPGIERRIEYLRKELSTKIKKAKRNACKEFITVEKPWGKPYKIVVKSGKRQTALLPKEILLQKKLGNCPQGTDGKQRVESNCLTQEEMEEINIPPDLIADKLKLICNRKSPGSDVINYKILKLLNIEFPIHSLQISSKDVLGIAFFHLNGKLEMLFGC